jgi:tRNA threonylcarbamoyladenosine biosynthesis protein TsaB
MRVLGIETSSRRGTVALLDGDHPVIALAHEERNAHAERMLPLVERALAEAGWTKSQLQRIGVGVGPGSFTGVRVGIALAQGLALGLSVPLVGVTSLAAMAAAVPRHVRGPRVPLLDARRNELFWARYGEDGEEMAAPGTLARAAVAKIRTGAVVIGEVCDDLGIVEAWRSSATDLPHAQFVALLTSQATPDGLPVEPLYAREADAVKPREPPDALVGVLARERPATDASKA